MATINIVSTDPESQGPFVVVEEENFDAETMTEYVEEGESPKRGRKPKAE